MSTMITRTPLRGSNDNCRKRLLTTTTLVAAGMIASSAARAGDDVGQYDVWEFGSFEAGAEGTITGESQGYVQYSGDRIIGDLIQEDIGALGHVDLRARLTVARGVESGPMQILGRLSSSGEVFVLDVNGVLFGANSVVDTAGFAAIGGDVANADFMDGDNRLSIDVAEGAEIIIQEGAMINVGQAGLAAFVAPSVVNSGIINAKMGTVAFAAGEKVTLDMYGDGLVEVAVEGELADALLENKGRINAEGGTVQMSALAAKDVVDNIINVEGVVTVASVSQQGGKIILSGGNNGTVAVSGTLDASGTEGGDVNVTGQIINIAEQAKISVDGNNEGNGGNAVIIADNKAIFRGNITATGGLSGGFVEVSGHDLELGGTVTVGDGGVITFDQVIFDIGAAAAATIVASLAGGGTTNVEAEEQINVNATIDSSAQGNAATLHFADEGGAAGLEVNLNAGISLGGSQNLTGEATVVNVNTDAATIQSGVDIAQAGGTVNVADGTYNENVVINKNLSLIGDPGDPNVPGAGSPLIQGSGSGIGIAASGAVTDLTVSGFAVDNFDLGIGANIGIGTVVGDTQVDINNNTITNVSSGVFVDEFADANIAFNVIDVTGDNSIVFGENIVFNDAIHVEDFASTTAHVTDNILTSSTGLGDDGISVEDIFDNDTMTVFIERNEISGFGTGIDLIDNATVTISQNKITGNGKGVEIDADVNADNVTIFGNDLSGNTGFAVDNNANGRTADASGNWWGTTDEAAVLAMTDGLVDITPYLEAGTDTDGGATGFGGDFDEIRVTTLGKQVQSGGRINEGVDVVNVSGTINVNAGTYNESVDVDKLGVTLRGANRGIHGSGVRGPESIVMPNSPGFNITADNVTIDGFEIDGGAAGVVVDGGNNATVKNNVIHNQTDPSGNGDSYGSFAKGDPVAVKNSAGSKVQDNRIFDYNDDGVQASNVDGVEVSGNTIHDNGEGDLGVSVADSTGTLDVKNNIITDVRRHGVQLINVNGTTTVSGNRITNSTANGVSVIDSNTVQVNANTISIAQNGVAVSGSTNVLVGNEDGDNDNGNTIDNTTLDGVVASNSEGIKVVDNNIGTVGGAGNIGQDGVHINGSNGASVADNTIQNTVVQGVLVNPSDDVRVTGNNISHIGLDGVRVEGGMNTYIAENIINNIGDDGMHLNGTAHATVFWNQISHTGLDSSDGEGIQVENSHHVTIDKNILEYLGDDGVDSDNSSHVYVMNNFIAHAGDDGIDFDGTAGDASNTRDEHVKIDNNIIYDVEDDGVDADDISFLEITNNWIDWIGSDGAEIDDSDHITVQYNEIQHTDSDGVEIDDSDDVDISYNNFRFVDDDGIDADDINRFDIKGNSFMHMTDGDAIDVDDSKDVYIYDNFLKYIYDNGIEISDSSNVEIDSNRIFYAGGDGINVDNVTADDGGIDEINIENPFIDYFGGFALVITNNTIGKVGDNGVEVSDSGRLIIASNEIMNTGLSGFYDIDFEGEDSRSIIFDEEAKEPVERTYGGYEGGSYGLSFEGREGDGGDGVHVRNSGFFEGAIPGIQTAGDLNGTFVGYRVNIIDNYINTTGDDGVEVVDSASTLVAYNEIENTGASIGNNEEWNDYGFGDYGFGSADHYGGDGIHIRGVHGSAVKTKLGDSEGPGIYGDYGFQPYSVVVYGNDINNVSDDGVEVVESGRTLIEYNHISNTGLTGYQIVHHEHDSEQSSYGDYGFYQELYFSGGDEYGADGIHVRMEGRSITKEVYDDYGHGHSGTVVDIVENNVNNSLTTGIHTEGIDVLRVLDNIVTNSGEYGYKAGGAYHGLIELSGNSFTNNPVSALFESGSWIDLTGPGNNFVGGDKGIVFRPYFLYEGKGGPMFADMNLVDDDAPGFQTREDTLSPTNYGGTLGSQFFSGQSTFFVELDNEAFTTEDGRHIWLNGLNSTYVTPFGTVTPSSTGGALSFDQFNFLETRFEHFPDTLNTGIFFFGFGIEQGIENIEDFFNQFDPFGPGANGLNVTITGLPPVSTGPQNLANIEPAAGDGETSEELANVEPEAGGSGDVACWLDAIIAASEGNVVNFGYDGTQEENIEGTTNCSTPQTF